ncbi:hypothetical protein WJX74_009346 [Apatococcus lobatus]|uniref:Plastid division regulator MinE n=1 Tax=Apatococcus lobatus TaxID=904363 RepID=A0AAW1QU39_9CHLO
MSQRVQSLGSLCCPSIRHCSRQQVSVQHSHPAARRSKAVASSQTSAGSELTREAEVVDVASLARQRVNSPPTVVTKQSPVSDFMMKVRAAWRIFFPPAPMQSSPKDEGKNRLRMILVADRCGMNETSMLMMKNRVLAAVADFVDIAAEEQVHVNVTMDEAVGTVYSVSMPVKRVKPQARLPLGEDSTTPDGVVIQWDEEDSESDPSDRFPFGT